MNKKFFLFLLFITISVQQTTTNYTYNRTKLRERYIGFTDEEIDQRIKEKEERRARRKKEKEEKKKRKNRISFEEAEKIHQRQIEEGHRPKGISDEEFKKLLKIRELENEKIEQKKKEIEEDLRKNISLVLKDFGLENQEKINKTIFKKIYDKLVATEDSVKLNKTMNDTEKKQVLKFHQDITEYFMKDIPEEIEVNNLITYFNTKRLNTLVNDFLYDQQNKKNIQKTFEVPIIENSTIVYDDSGSYEYVDLRGNTCPAEKSENKNKFDFLNKKDFNDINKEDL